MHYLTEEESAAVFVHFPEITQKAIDYATNVVLKDSKYIFVKKAGAQLVGYCTHCRYKFPVEGPVKQNATGTCPICLKESAYKKSWLGRKHLQDRASFLWFEKSPVNPQMITASWIYCYRDYKDDYEKVETRGIRTTIYTFEIGESAMYNVNWFNENKLEKRKSVYNNLTSLDMDFAMGSLVEAARGTPFQYSGWEKFSYLDSLKYLALYAERPNVEILTKNGFEKIVVKYLDKKSLHGSINWNAYKLHEFFKLTKQEFKMMADSEATGKFVMHAPEFPFGLWLWKQARKEKSKISYKELITACNTFQLDDYKDRFKKIRKYSTIHRIVNYAKRQYEFAKKHYRTPPQVLIEWSDYIDECVQLDYDLSDDLILFPKDLKKAHLRTSKLIKIKEDEAANEKIQKRFGQLEHLIFMSEGLEIRPPKTFNEIVEEGKKLRHCVGGYAKSYSEGRCTLLFIRDSNKPDTPFYTVELNGQKIVQVRGRENKSATKEVDQFMERFKLLLEKPKSKARQQA